MFNHDPRWRLGADPEIQIRMAWPEHIPAALAYVATELKMHVGEVAFGYLMESRDFGDRETIKRHFAPLFESKIQLDFENVWHAVDFGGCLGWIWPNVAKKLPKAMLDARAVGDTQHGRKLREDFARMPSEMHKRRAICDLVENVLAFFVDRELETLKGTT